MHLQILVMVLVVAGGVWGVVSLIGLGCTT